MRIGTNQVLRNDTLDATPTRRRMIRNGRLSSVVFRNYLELFPRLLRRCGVARRRHSPAMTSGSGPQPVAGVQAGARHAAQAAGFHPPLALPRRKIHRKFLQLNYGTPH